MNMVQCNNAIGKTILLLFLLLPAILPAEENSNRHYCTDQDFIGNAYTLVFLSEDPPKREGKHFNPNFHKYLGFNQNNYYAMAGSKDAITSQARMNKVFNWDNKNQVHYRYVAGAKGDLAFLYDTKIKERYQCIAVSKAQNGYMAGDIIFTSYPVQDSDYKLVKLYRRWVASTTN